MRGATILAAMAFVLAAASPWPNAAFADSSDDLLVLVGPIVAGRCTFTLDKTNLAFNASGGDQSVAVTASGPICAWVTEIPAEASAWLTATAKGAGSGSVTVAAAANTGTDPRSATIQVAGKAVAIDQPGAGASTFTLPDTGETKCYDNSGEITCPGSGQDFYGQDGNFQGVQPSYLENGDDTVTDQVTGLMWQQYDVGSKTWADAVTYCQESRLGDHADWRLPSRRELLSIVDAGRFQPASNPAFTCASEFYWSDTTLASNSGYAWSVTFADGFSNGRSKSDALQHVRCVRGTALPNSVYTDNGDDTVTDQTTGLMWEKAGSSSTMDWENALAACVNNATTGGYSDWRLPNKRELEILIDDSQYNPTIASVFSGPVGGYWSGTTFSGTAVTCNSNCAWYVNFQYGISDDFYFKQNANYVRCVRGGSQN